MNLLTSTFTVVGGRAGSNFSKRKEGDASCYFSTFFVLGIGFRNQKA
jgi:hypothetical protein